MPVKIEFYRDASGRAPVEEYLNDLDCKVREKTMRTIALLGSFGRALREPESKHLGDGVYELRTVFGGYSGRVLYFFFYGDRAVLTHGFGKKTRKTPRNEIDRAKRYRNDYMNRHGAGS